MTATQQIRCLGYWHSNVLIEQIENTISRSRPSGARGANDSSKAINTSSSDLTVSLEPSKK